MIDEIFRTRSGLPFVQSPYMVAFGIVCLYTYPLAALATTFTLVGPGGRQWVPCKPRPPEFSGSTPLFFCKREVAI
jgi:hypothetical protein